MEDNSLIIKKQAKRAAYVVGIATFLGFSAMMFIPDIYRLGIFTPYLILGYIMLIPVGLLQSFIFGWIIYFIFKRFIKNKLIYGILLTIGIIICFVIGLSSQVYILRTMSKTPPYKNEIDTNKDGKIDKWVYDDNLNTRIEIDIDYDGKPDIKEYSYNADLLKREYYKNGVLIKTEEFPKVKYKRQ